MVKLDMRPDRVPLNDYRVTWIKRSPSDRVGVLMEAYAPDTVAEIADVIGFELATKLVLELGGAEQVGISEQAKAVDSAVARSVGPEAARALAKHFGLRMSIPVARAFCCQVLRSRGLSGGEISEMRHMSIRGVWRALAQGMPVTEPPNKWANPLITKTLSSKD